MLVLMLRPNHLPLSRFGFSVSKRVGNAVQRNGVRRRLREIARNARVKDGQDLVVIARARAVSANYIKLDTSLKALLARAGALKSSGRKD